MNQQVYFEDLGLISYQSAWDYQEKLLARNVQQKAAAAATTHHLLLLEHTPVYTLGKSGHEENVLITDTEREARGIEFFRTNRGGDITFHGPGQLVGYPVLDLERYYRDIGKYLRNLEEMVIDTLLHYGITGARSKGETGVWLDPDIPGRERKICAMGVRCSRWITMHGFALNANTDLSYFDQIIPCGIQNKKVSSIQQEVGSVVSMVELKEVMKKSFEKVFESELISPVADDKVDNFGSMAWVPV